MATRSKRQAKAKNGFDKSNSFDQPDSRNSFCNWCCYWCCCGCCCDKQSSSKIEGQAGNGKQSTHTEMNDGQSADGQASGRQSAIDNATTATNKSNSGQPASGQQSANDNKNIAENKGSSGQAFGQQSINDNVTTEKSKGDSGQVLGQQSANDNATTATNKSNSGQVSDQQSANDIATTEKRKSSSGQASGQQSANDNATTATNKSNSGQGSDQQSANDIATTEKNKSTSGQASGQQSANDNASAKKQSNFGQASGQQSANDSAAKAKNKSSSSGQASVQLNQKQEHNSESPGVGEKSKNDKLLGTSGSSDQDSGKKTGGTEQAVHNSSLKGAVRQEDTKKNGKDLNPRKENNSNLEHSSKEQPKGPPLKNEKDKLLGTSGSSDQDLGKKTGGTKQPVHNSLPKGDVKIGKDLNPQKGNNSNSEHSLEEQPKGPQLKIEKQKDFGKQPGFKNKDNTNIDTSLPNIVSSARNPSSEQQKDVPKQAKNIENQINTRTSSPVIANSSSLGQGRQILSQEQQKSVTKPEGIKKDDKNTVPSHVRAENNIGEASKQQQKIVG
ncbi:hypothetical protein Patl1_27619 [Pistacia atlantica]|uniref:Uncharacterized protein n=1 Tax=Pistacia atlantica TaxID=434234 RepID=A0ACC1BG91_9ROSI|nr:hypothetical protein Patl1_27619 [Pistacia atlantica]